VLGKYDPLRKTFAATDLYSTWFSIKPKEEANDNDIETARALIARWRNGNGNSVAILGSYKIVLGEISSLAEDDHHFIEALFPDSLSMFLTISATRDDRTTATLTIRDGSELRTEFNDSFPLSSGPAQKTSGLRVAPAAPKALSSQQSSEAKWTILSNLTKWRVIIASAVLAVLIGIAASRVKWGAAIPDTPRSPSTHLGLLAEMNGNGLVISWDSHANAIQKAERGILWITDGNVKRAFELSRTDLDYGRVSYTPNGGRVSLRMEVTFSDRLASESLLVLNDSASAVIAPARSFADLSDGATEGVGAFVPPVQQLTSSDSSRELTVPAPKTGPSAGSRKFKQSALSSDIPDARPLLAAETLSPPVPVPYSLPRAKPVETATAGPLASKVSIAGSRSRASNRPTASEYVGPRILKSFVPRFSPQQAALAAGSPLRVKVVLNGQGDVQQASAVSVPRLLQGFLQDAARRFKFAPARLNGIPVSSEVEINFVIEPDN